MVITFDELHNKYRDSIMAIANNYHIENIRIFGSVATGKANSDSDIDMLVSLGKEADLLDLGGFYNDVQELLKTQKVDVVEDKSIHWYIKDRVLQEAKPL